MGKHIWSGIVLDFMIDDLVVFLYFSTSRGYFDSYINPAC